MFCIKCGKELPEDSAFCPRCGEKIKQAAELDPDSSNRENLSNVRTIYSSEKNELIKQNIVGFLLKIKNRILNTGKSIKLGQMNYNSIYFKIFSILFIGWFSGEPFQSFLYGFIPNLFEPLSYQVKNYISSLIIVGVVSAFAFIPLLQKFIKRLLKINSKFLMILWIILSIWYVLDHGIGIGTLKFFPIGWTSIPLFNGVTALFNINDLFNTVDLLLPAVSIWLLLKIKPKTPILPSIMVLAVSIPNSILYAPNTRYGLMGIVENYANRWMDCLTVLFLAFVFVIALSSPKSSKKISFITGIVVLLLPLILLQKELMFFDSTIKLTSHEIISTFFSILREKAPIFISAMLLSFCYNEIKNADIKKKTKILKIKSVIVTSIIAISTFFAISAGFSVYGSALINKNIDNWIYDIKNGVNITESGNWNDFEETENYKDLFFTKLFVTEYEDYIEISKNYNVIKKLCEVSALYYKAVVNENYISEFSDAYKDLNFSEYDESSMFSAYNGVYDIFKPLEDKIDIDIREGKNDNEIIIKCKNDNITTLNKVIITVEFKYLYAFYENYVDSEFHSFTETFVLEDVDDVTEKAFKVNPEDYYNGLWTCLAEMLANYEIIDISID